VGTNVFTGSVWKKLKDVSYFYANSTLPITEGGAALVVPIGKSGGTDMYPYAGAATPTAFARTQAGYTYPASLSVSYGCVSTSCYPIQSNQTNSDTAVTASGTPAALFTYSMVAAYDADSGTNIVRIPGTAATGLTVDVKKLPSSTQSTTGVTTNVAGTTVTMTTTPPTKYTMIIDRTAGATDVVEIDLQCSINNTAFVQIATITSLVNEPVLTSIGDIPCAYLRYNVVTIGAGNTVSIDLLATR
jgi:hypothetical protein